MNKTIIKILLIYAESYAIESMGKDASISSDVEPNDVIESLFESKAQAEEIFQYGQKIISSKQHNIRKLYYDIENKGWMVNPTNSTISLFALAVILDKWDWINANNPFEKAAHK